MENYSASQDAVFKEYDHEKKRQNGVEFTIDHNGYWYTHAVTSPGPIKRRALAKLFGGAGTGFMAGKGLRKTEEGGYTIQSPDGEYKVDVEDVPFLITDIDPSNSAKMTTNLGEAVILTNKTELYFKPEPLRGVDVLYVHVRDGLFARVTRSVFAGILNYIREGDGRYEYVCHDFTIPIKMNENNTIE